MDTISFVQTQESAGIPKAAEVDLVEPHGLGVDLGARKLPAEHKTSLANDGDTHPSKVAAHCAGSDAEEHDTIPDEVGDATGVVLFGDPGLGQRLRF